MSRKLKRDEALQAICRYAEANGGAKPSTRQLATLLMVSQSRAWMLLNELEDEGRIARVNGRIRVIGERWEADVFK